VASSPLKVPTIRALLTGKKADAKEVVEDPRHGQDRYGQQHTQQPGEPPADYHGQQDQDRVDVQGLPWMRGIR
jgi:hypothetical protein